MKSSTRVLRVMDGSGHTDVDLTQMTDEEVAAKFADLIEHGYMLFTGEGTTRTLVREPDLEASLTTAALPIAGG